MSQDPTEQTPREFEQIEPTKIEITSKSPEPPQSSPAQESSAGRRRWIIACCAVSAVLILLVFIILPRIVSKPDIVVEAPVVKKAPVEEASPWQEAQMARDRKAAQEVLQNLLDKQFTLEEVQVALWGQEDFSSAAELAREGDDSYRQQAFQEASAKYSDALTKLTKLLDSLPAVIQEKLDQGYAAIDAGDAAAATQIFELILKVEPNNSQAAKGLKRAGTLDQVVALSDKAELEEKNGNLDQAKVLLEQARALDSDSQRVNSRLAGVNSKILERDFTAAMSQGYSALQQSQFDNARSSFRRAQKLKPEAQEARSGLEEVAHRITQNRITAYRQQAEKLIADEQWQAAAEQYKAVLQLDASVLFAQEGHKQTSDRARLDQLLLEQINNPERLASDGVYQEAGALLKVAATVKGVGPRLRHQIVQLQNLMQEARTPIQVTISSDNQTDVILLRSGSLGNFLSHELSLLPGRYVLVGKRAGFRDVRREFVVSANQPSTSINIECTEKI